MSLDFLREIWTNRWVKLAALIAGILLFVYLIVVLRSILTALAIAWVLAYICDPLVDRLEARRIPRTAGVIIFTVVLVLVIVLAGLILLPTIANEFERLGKDMPDYGTQIGSMIENFEQRYDINLPHTAEDLSVWFSVNQETVKQVAEQIYTPIVSLIKNSLNSIMAWVTFLLTLIVVPVAWFFLLRDIDRINEKIVNLVPPRRRDSFLEFMHQVDEIISNFLRGQIVVAMILAVLYAIGLWLILDIPLGLLIALFAGVASIVPYLGVVLGILPAMAMAFLQYQDWQHPLGVILVFAVAQALEGNLITPKIVGDKLGLHPVTVIFALLIWAQLLGFFGMLIAVPLTAVLQVVLMRLIDRYQAGELYLGKD